MERNEEQVMEIDLKEVFFVLLDNVKWIIAAGIVGCLCAFLLTKFAMTPQYQSSTSVYILSAQNEDTTSYSDLQTSSMLANDCAVLVKSRSVTSRVIEELNLDITDAKLASCLSVEQSSNSGRIITISVTYPDAKEAQKIADSVREIASQYFIDVMGLQMVNTVEEASFSEVPSSPSLVKNIVLGVLIGLVLSMGIIVVIFIFDNKIRTEEDIERFLGLTVLGVIPDRDDVSDRDQKGNLVTDTKSKKAAPAKKKVR